MSPVKWQSRIRDSALVRVIGYELDNPRIVVPLPTGANIFLISQVSPPVLGPTQLYSQWATGVLPLGEKSPSSECERERSHVSSAKVKNECSYASAEVKKLPVMYGICSSITVFTIVPPDVRNLTDTFTLICGLCID